MRSAGTLSLFLLLLARSSLFADSLTDDYNRLWLMEGRGQLDEASQVARSIIERDPMFEDAYALLSRIEYRRGRLPELREYLGRLLQRTPAAHFGLSTYFVIIHRPDLSQKELKACVLAGLRLPSCYWSFGGAIAEQAKQAGRVSAPDEIKRLLNKGSEDPFACLAYAGQAFSGTSHFSENPFRCIALFQEKPEELTLLAAALVTGSSCGRAPEPHACVQSLSEIASRTALWQNNLALQFPFLTKEHETLPPADAIEQLNRDLAYYRGLGQRTAEAELLGALYRIYARSGELENAQGCAEQGNQIAREQHSPDALVWSERRGAILSRRGDSVGARRAFEDELGIANESPRDALGAAFAHRYIGVTCLDAGDYVCAIRHGEESVRQFRELGKEWQAGAGVGNIGIAYSLLGDYKTAERYAKQSYAAALRHYDPGEVQRNLLVFGDLCLRQGDNQRARQKFEAALSWSAKAKWPPYDIEALTGLGTAYRRLGQLHKAREEFNAALVNARKQRIPASEAEALSELGDCDVASGMLDGAAAHYTASLDITERAGFPELIVAARRGLARVAILRKADGEALQHLKKAIEEIEQVRGHIPSPGLQSGFSVENTAVYHDAIAVLARRYRGQADASLSAEAFRYAEMARARGFLDSLGELARQAPSGISPNEVSRLSVLRASLSHAMESLMTADTPQNRANADSAERRLSEFDTHVRVECPTCYELFHPQVVSAEEAKHLASKAGAAIVVYSLGERESYAFVVTSSHLFLFTLPSRALIEKEVRALRATLITRPESASDESYRASSQRLYEMLLRPVLTEIGSAKRLLISPDGILHYLPFETLTNRGRYLIEDSEVTYIPSVSSYAAVVNRIGLAARPMDLLAYADPSSGQTPATARLATPVLLHSVYQPSAGIHFPPLPNACREVEAIAGLYPPNRSTVRCGVAASKDSVLKERLESYKLIHFATHSLIDEEWPARSGIVLSSTGDDRVLRLNDVMGLRLNAELVVLSACKTGLGKVVKGEGLIGLTRAFLHAGASRVVVSLWDVNDVSGVDFMKSFYGFMKSKDGAPAAALRQAKLAMIHSNIAAYHHPYFWALFVQSGIF